MLLFCILYLSFILFADFDNTFKIGRSACLWLEEMELLGESPPILRALNHVHCIRHELEAEHARKSKKFGDKEISTIEASKSHL